MGVKVDGTGSPSASTRLGDDQTAEKKQAKQFNQMLNQANAENGSQEADDEDTSSPKTTPQPKAIGGLPTTQSLVTGPKFTDEQIYAETDAASKRIDEQIAEDRGIAKKPYEKRLQHARERVSDSMDTWGDPKNNATKMTGDMVWNYGRNNSWKDDQGREHPFFTASEKKAVYEDQKSKEQLAQQEQKEASERERARVQTERARQWENQGDQLRSPATVLQPFAFGALGVSVYAAYAGIQTGKAIGDAYNACQSGPTADCLAAVTHAGIAVATDVYTAKSSVQNKSPQVDPPPSSIPPGPRPDPTTARVSPKLLDSKPTGRITSDPDPRSVKLARRGQGVERTVYEAKKASPDPDAQAEARMAEHLDADGHKVHFNANDRFGDLQVDGKYTDVKHLNKPDGVKSAITNGRKQAPQVAIDGTTVRLSEEQAVAGIREFEAEAAKRPETYRGIETVYFLLGDGKVYVYHRTGPPLKVEKVGAGGTGLPR